MNSQYGVEKVLDGVKLYLDILPENEEFDDTLLTYVNDSMSYVTQDIGIGPKDGFKVSKKTLWSEIVPSDLFHDVRTLIALRIKLLFDPPQVAAVISAIERQIDEVEWRLANRADVEKMRGNYKDTGQGEEDEWLQLPLF